MRGGLHRAGGAAGLLYVAVVVAANAVAGAPDESSTRDAALLAFYNDDGDRLRVFAAAVAIGAAVPAFLLYLLALCDRLAGGDPAWPPVLRLAFASGAAFATVDALGFAIGAAAPATMTYSSELDRLRDAETLRVLLVLGNHWLAGFASVLAVPLVLGSSLHARAARLLPRPLAWAGIVLGALLLLSQLAFLGIPVNLWITATAIWLVAGRYGSSSASSRAGRSRTREAY